MCGHVGVVCTSHLGPTGLTFLWKSGKALRWESPSPLKSSRDALFMPGGLSESLPLPSYLPHSSVPEQGPKGGPSSSALGHTLLWQKPTLAGPWLWAGARWTLHLLTATLMSTRCSYPISQTRNKVHGGALICLRSERMGEAEEGLPPRCVLGGALKQSVTVTFSRGVTGDVRSRAKDNGSIFGSSVPSLVSP